MTEGEKKPEGLGRFMTMRVIAGIIFGIAALGVVWFVSDWFGGDEKSHVEVASEHKTAQTSDHGAPGPEDADIAKLLNESAQEEDFPLELAEESKQTESGDSGAGHGTGSGQPGGFQKAPKIGTEVQESPFPQEHGAATPPPVSTVTGAGSHGASATHESKTVGVNVVEGTVAALGYELNDRFWGWRRNDLIRLTDNVENMQLGILEVVRRTSVVMMERLSRHGVSGSIDKNLENAMNGLMINSDRYWLPSAEEKYNESIKELRAYAASLEKGEARFFVRADNLIPLLLSLAELAGSCDENLVKSVEEDGSSVGWTRADDYFYYSKGVAIAMGKILHGVSVDFAPVLEARNGVDLINRAIHACHVAAELDPWIVTEGALDGLLANHRANMASEISHLRYFLNLLATTLST